MKYIKKQVNNFLSKAKEFSNRKQILENDKLVSKYFDLIYQDWDFYKDLNRVKIYENSGYIGFSYLVSDNKKADVMWANRDEGDITINLTLIEDNILLDWQRDISRGRIEAHISTSIGESLLFGRKMENNKVVENERGIEDIDTWSYLNISKNKIEKIINYFLNFIF